MPIAVTEEHESLRRTAERWLQTHCPPTEPRAVAEAPQPGRGPAGRVGEDGRAGLARAPPARGRSVAQGFTLAELAVVLEELGHALFPGPVLPTLLVSAAAGPPRGTRRCGRRCCPAWPTAPSRRRSRSAPPALQSGPAGDGAVGLSAAPCAPSSDCPTARLVLVPLDRTATPTARSGACSTARRLGDGRHGRGAPGARCHPRRRIARASAGGSSCPAPQLLRCPTTRCAAWRSSWSRRRARGSPAGVSRRPRSTPRCGCSSAVPSASSRRSSTRWPTCWWPSSSAPRWPGTPRRHGARTARDADRELSAAHRRRGRARCGRPLRQGVHPDPGRHRLHLGARRALLPQAGHGQPAAGRRR